MPFRILAKEIRPLMRKAVRLSREHREICGVIVENGYFLHLIEVRNKSKCPGSFWLHFGDVNRVDNACQRLGNTIVGTFHSHIIGAEPSRPDIAGADHGQLMLILDTCWREIGLWRIREARAYRLKHQLI
ncbi:MAG: Mov34/MPN/PAD-1 family protein [Candidatus Hydrogenedentes bacterium]|nr:Mov34/MPN/PAD-1 family protein [Candidatus Hydrogenedentota bacterium]